ncbi:MAG: PEP-CTERM sorting domain-containing protein [Burkholderiaceae bacterium]|jgi:spermidine synthase
MPDSAQHVKPFVYESLGSKAMHFSICEIQSRMSLTDPDALDLEYTRTMMGFLMFKPEPATLAMIGLGGGSMAKFCWRHLPRTRLQVVEINPHVIALRDEFKVPADDARFCVTRADGAHFVRHCTTPVDVLLVDGFDSDGLPASLSSQRFYDDCLDALRPDGILVVNLHSGHRRFDAHVERVRRSFNGAILVVDGGEPSNTIVFAFKGRNLDSQRDWLIRRPKGLGEGAAQQLSIGFALIESALKKLGG